ncbi:hypothetical protein [Aeoliella mucimassa]|uniref:hypothetical protein n=1 Tax=Aeoliella mucimassa TaxID=2527972 RepID=UPI0018D2FCBE|nr:hypothetical protein [Aeoliella mucimassa]
MPVVEDLQEALQTLANEEVKLSIDCQHATHLDGAVCQLLLVANQSWPGGSDCFDLINVSPELQEHLERSGVCDATGALTS